MQSQLESEMKKAAAAHEFEKAADLRDLIRDLNDTWKKTEKFARVPYTLPLSIQPEKDLVELANILGLTAPPMRIEGFDISNISGTFAVASLVSFKNGRPDRANYRRFKIKTVEGQDDFASIAEVVRRRYTRVLNESFSPTQKTKNDDDGHAVPQELQKLADETSRKVRRGLPVKLPPNNEIVAAVYDRRRRSQNAATTLPDLILIDGGKGQLGAACAELKKLGLEKIPVIGLAKEFEEIYLPEKSLPLRLGLDHPAVKLLQRVRDECHRVANSYNAQLRLKKISESVLDEFPGIGDRRKAALLKKFGSVRRLQLATVEQISEVSGFGGKAAEELKGFLLARSREATT
jgi:excinuclease ABC subunit C